MNIVSKFSSLFFLALISMQTSWARSEPIMPVYHLNSIKVQTRLSQTKLVQHGANTIFADMTFTPPMMKDDRRPQLQRSTDYIIILDRSGSMSEARKMPYAKAAIWDVLGRLKHNDRFALVSFSDNAIVQSPLVKVTPDTRHYLNDVVRSIRASGGTNMGEGLNSAINLLDKHNNHRAKKILLLSDGQANQGITNPQQLASIAARATEYGAVVSTIGMGLGFNENLMAKIADYGMGNYSFLEDLSGLAGILSRDLNDTRNIYANSGYLDIQLGEGVRLIDAGGYPISQRGSSTIRVSTGQMLVNTPKHFVMTFHVPTENTGLFSLGSMTLNYKIDGELVHTRINPQALVLAVVAPKYRNLAQESIDQEIYQNSWTDNNMGIMKKKLSKWMREGSKDKAKQAIKEYRQEIKAASEESNVSLSSSKMERKLVEMESQVDDAFAGSSMDQRVKRNRAAKQLQYDSISTQRK